MVDGKPGLEMFSLNDAHMMSLSLHQHSSWPTTQTSSICDTINDHFLPNHGHRLLSHVPNHLSLVSKHIMNTLRSSQMTRLTDQSYKKCLQDSSDSGVAFIDQLFKAEDHSVFTDRSFLSDVNISRIVWKRPREMTDDPRLIFTQKVG